MYVIERRLDRYARFENKPAPEVDAADYIASELEIAAPFGGGAAQIVRLVLSCSVVGGVTDARPEVASSKKLTAETKSMTALRAAISVSLNFSALD